MTEDRQRERDGDLVLNPLQQAYILDETKGHVTAYVGPTKVSPSNTDQPVTYDPEEGQFVKCSMTAAITTLPSAAEGHYLVLDNPAKDNEHPQRGTANPTTDLEYGRQINIPGPIMFPLWPGQDAVAIEGHNLRSNQYLLVRVRDEDEARRNWTDAVVKKVDKKGEGEVEGGEGKDVETDAPSTTTDLIGLSTGKLMIIKGTEISFYIPPTGIEVVKDEDNDNYIRDAVTLERLEYCVLLNENGEKRFVHGPAVVFPEPTENFIKTDVMIGDRKTKTRRHKPIELSEVSGVYVKVTAAYEENGREYKEGQELFITGQEQMIYFPRAEHAIIKYGGYDTHHAIAIPTGSGRYVMERLTGKINIVKGPAMFLPDPRTQVMIRRVLGPSVVTLLYPNNDDAMEYNKKLAEASEAGGSGFVTERRARSKGLVQHEFSDAEHMYGAVRATPASYKQHEYEAVGEGGEGGGDEITRKQSYTPLPSITVGDRFEGAIGVNIWTGYALQIIPKVGERRVEVGPKNVLLEYDEDVEVMELSTGKPKNTDNLQKTAFLRVKNNKVGDILTLETRDMVDVEVKLSYRVNFEGNPNMWFNVENYVKFLCDHCRSLLKKEIKSHGVEEMNQRAIDIVRDALLGKSTEKKIAKIAEDEKMPDEDEEAETNESSRPGRTFKENGMHIYDVEVLKVTIGDAHIATLLVSAQHEAVQRTLSIAKKEADLEATKREEKLEREMIDEREKTKAVSQKSSLRRIEESQEKDMATVEGAGEARLAQEGWMLKVQASLSEIEIKKLERQKAGTDQDLSVALSKIEHIIKSNDADAEALVKKMTAITPDLIAALQAQGDKDLAIKLAESVGAHALLKGNSMADVLAQLAQGVPGMDRLEIFKQLPHNHFHSGNGNEVAVEAVGAVGAVEKVETEETEKK